MKKAFFVGGILVMAVVVFSGIGWAVDQKNTGCGLGSIAFEGQEALMSQTLAVTTVALFQAFYMLNCRSLRDSVLRIGLLSNPTVYVGIVALILLQLAFVYLPLANRLFGTAGLDADAWFKSVATALVVLPLISLEKLWRRRRERRDDMAQASR